MKRIFTFLLAVVMILSLAACGGKSDEPTKPIDVTGQPTEDTAPDVTEDTEPEVEIAWEMRDDVKLEIPEFEIEKITINGSTQEFETVKNPFDLTLEKAESTLSDYEMQDYNMHEYISTTDDEIDGVWTYGINYDFTESRFMSSASDNMDIFVETNTDTTISNEPSGFTIIFYPKEFNAEAQTKIYETMKSLVGEVWANYLVYAKDGNSLSRFDDALDNEYHLEDFIQVGNIKLLCERSIDSKKVSFYVGIEHDSLDYCSINTGNYISKYDDTFTYRLESVFPAITPDYANVDNIYADFFALHNARKLPHSRIDSVSIQKGIYKEYTSYYVSIDVMSYDKDNVSADGDTFTVRVSLDEYNDGTLQNVLIRAYGDEMLSALDDMDEKAVLEKMKTVIPNKLTYLLKDIKTFTKEWKTGEQQTFEDTYKVECFDAEFDYMLDVNISPADEFISWNVQLTSPDMNN